jgi:hypothetical protein
MRYRESVSRMQNVCQVALSRCCFLLLNSSPTNEKANPSQDEDAKPTDLSTEVAGPPKTDGEEGVSIWRPLEAHSSR